MLKEGDKVPDFELLDQNGKTVRLKDFAGKKVVLFFYPRAMTPGCTRECIAFSGLVKTFQKAGAVVLGCSPDKPESQKKFEDKEKLNIPLLSDPDKKVAEAYGAYGEKVMYGKKVKGIIRSTFLIDETGKLTRSWSKVKVDGHAEKVLEAARG